jgi:hypothetical protein
VGVDLLGAEVNRDTLSVGELLLEFLYGKSEPSRQTFLGMEYPGSGAPATYQVIENTLVQLPLGLTALPQLLVVVLKTLPVLAELFQAVLVDVLDPVQVQAVSHCAALGYGLPGVFQETWIPMSEQQVLWDPGVRWNRDLHTGGASRHTAAFLQALGLALAGVLVLALHEVIVVGAASGTDEERCGEKGSRGGTNLRDLGDVVGEGCRVDEDLLVEAAGGKVSLSGPEL